MAIDAAATAPCVQSDDPAAETACGARARPTSLSGLPFSGRGTHTTQHSGRADELPLRGGGNRRTPVSAAATACARRLPPQSARPSSVGTAVIVGLPVDGHMARWPSSLAQIHAPRRIRGGEKRLLSRYGRSPWTPVVNVAVADECIDAACLAWLVDRCYGKLIWGF
jgi:hypothetical protein